MGIKAVSSLAAVDCWYGTRLNHAICIEYLDLDINQPYRNQYFELSCYAIIKWLFNQYKSLNSPEVEPFSANIVQSTVQL